MVNNMEQSVRVVPDALFVCLLSGRCLVDIGPVVGGLAQVRHLQR